RVLRYLAARGGVDGPAAAAAAGDLLGGVRAGGGGSGVVARDSGRRVRRGDRPGVRPPAARTRRGNRWLPADREHGERRVGPAVVHLRVRGSGGDGGYGVFVVVGGGASGRAGVAAGGGVRGGGRGGGAVG